MKPSGFDARAGIIPGMTLYSTTAATIRLGADRATIEHLADRLELGRGGNRSEARANWLFTDAELDRMKSALLA